MRIPLHISDWRLGLRRCVAPALTAGLLLLQACAPTAPATIADADKLAPRSTQRQEGGQVTVTAFWGGPEAGPVFTLALDTHSVDLDSIDIAGLAALRTTEGEIAALDWNAPRGGHHRSGELTFPTTAPDGRPTVGDRTVELVIRDVAGVPERRFQWQP